MQRICSSLQRNGYSVSLVGVKRKSSINLIPQQFHQKRIPVFFEKGLGFYAEYNIRLFFYLFFSKTDALCAIDLDTIIPCHFVAALRNKKKGYDAHELFTELNEVVNNKKVSWFWHKVESYFVPRFKNGYTVNLFISEEFKRRYGVEYGIVRNLPFKKETTILNNATTLQIPFIIYQGAVNHGRGFEQLIPAMKQVNVPLHIYGTGNFIEQVKKIIQENELEDKVKLFGAILPADIQKITPTAAFGITIFESKGLNQYYSLANRFFDYIMAGIPQICVAYPEYKVVNNEFDIALMVDDIQPGTLAAAMNRLLADIDLYKKLKANTIAAAQQLNWESEEKKLINFWNSIFI